MSSLLGFESMSTPHSSVLPFGGISRRQKINGIGFLYKILLWSPAKSGSSSAYSTAQLGGLLSKFYRDLLLVVVVAGGEENDLLVSKIVEYLETSGCHSEIELGKYMRDDKSKSESVW